MYSPHSILKNRKSHPQECRLGNFALVPQTRWHSFSPKIIMILSSFYLGVFRRHPEVVQCRRHQCQSLGHPASFKSKPVHKEPTKCLMSKATLLAFFYKIFVQLGLTGNCLFRGRKTEWGKKEGGMPFLYSSRRKFGQIVGVIRRRLLMTGFSSRRKPEGLPICCTINRPQAGIDTSPCIGAWWKGLDHFGSR